MSPKSTGDPRDRISDGIRVRAPAIQRAAKPHGVVGDLKIRTMAPVDGPIPEIWTMILLGNMRRVSDLAANANTVLDVGGWWCPFNLATHVLDLMPYQTRRQHDALNPEHPPRFSVETWTVHDACQKPWPYPDKFFDFSFCSHTLEDVRDPVTVCSELVRVSRAGYVETPSRAREIFSKARWFSFRSFIGRPPLIGYDHHRWYVEIAGTHLRFIPKDKQMLSRRNIITRGDLGRKMTKAESGICLFWERSFTSETVSSPTEAELKRFRDGIVDSINDPASLLQISDCSQGSIRP